MKLLILFVVVGSLLAGAAVADTVAPLVMSNRSLGGTDLNQYTLGVAGGIGPNNIGLLIKTWGKVTYVNSAEEYFYIDDGANMVDGTRRPLPDNSLVLGVRVSYADLAPGAPPVTAPDVGDFAVVTGISSTVIVNDQVRPNVRVPKGTSIHAF